MNRYEIIIIDKKKMQFKMGFDDILFWVTPIVAAWGAILSTYTFIQKWRESRPKILVDFYTEFDEKEGHIIRTRNFLRARNIGVKTITLDYVYIEEFLDYKERLWNKLGRVRILNKLHSLHLIYPNRTDPVKLTMNNELLCGKSFNYELFFEEIHGTFGDPNGRKLIGVFLDQLENRYESEPVLQEFL